MGDFVRAFGDQLVLLVLVAAVSLVLTAALWRARPGPFGLNWPAAVLAAGSLVGIGVVTLTRNTENVYGGYVQLVPFATIRMYMHDGDTSTSVIVFLWGNIALFAPLGFFGYLAIRRSVLLTTALCALTSATVEVLQLPIWSRSTDVDDVICNTAGGLAGALLAAAGWHAWRAIRRRRPSSAGRRTATRHASPAARRG